MDANSSPERDERETVWKRCRAMNGVKSVWDTFFTAEGHARSSRPVATTNKMRGPLSGQANKIGHHMSHVIDHIFYRGLTFDGHVWGPTTYESTEEALRHLIPSPSLPSDHYPVVCDFVLPLPTFSLQSVSHLHAVAVFTAILAVIIWAAQSSINRE
mmetsp:Transcript_63285/g.125066  ORF Transcript_63285/g.125066 Transcript_63285/m.125066 type:complete len:157 (-) Transcript_63285:182-652(-)